MQTFFLLANVLYATWIVYISLENWAKSPTTTSIATVAAPNKDAPFPSLAVCPVANHYHSSWEVTRLVFNFLELLECKDDCDYNSVLEFRMAFQEFTDKIVDRHFAGTIPYNIKWSDGTPKPGGFRLEPPYKGLTHFYPFYLFYCELGRALSEKYGSSTEVIEVLTNRLKESIITQEPLTLDVLVQEEGVVIKIAEFTIMDSFALECDVSAEIMDFLGKLYFMDTTTVYRNFGNSLELLMAHGDLQIQSWASRVVFTPSGSIEVAVSSYHIDLIILELKTFCFDSLILAKPMKENQGKNIKNSSFVLFNSNLSCIVD